MQQMAFDNLVSLPVIQNYETAFYKATGMSIKVVPPGETIRHLGLGRFNNVFCAMVTRTPVGCSACLETERPAQSRTNQKFSPQQITCFAGLTHVSVPVLVAGQHVATLMT